MTIIGLSGSLRAGSFNTALLRAAASLMPEDSQLLVKTIHGIPLYDGDVEAATGIPAAVRELGEAIAKANGLLLVTPEYNNSIPGPFKNAIDWLSRIDDLVIFTGKPVAVIGASPADSARFSRRTPGCRCFGRSKLGPGSGDVCSYPARVACSTPTAR